MTNDNFQNDIIRATIAPPVGACSMSYTSASTGNSSLSLTIPRPESPTGIVGASIQGDLMLATIDLTIPNYSPLTVPSGWILITSTLIDNPGNNSDLSKLTYYKIAGANEPVSYTWTFGNPTKSAGGIVCIETGAASYSVFSKNDYAASGTNITSTGVTTNAVNTLVFGFFASASGKDVITQPATWISLFSEKTGGNSGSTSLAVVKAFPTIGATGSFTATTVESISRSVHTVGVLCRPRERASATVIATADASEVARVNNVFRPKTVTVTATASATPEVNNVFQPGALSFCDSTSNLTSLINGIGGAVASANANADMASLVDNVFQEITLYGSSIANVFSSVNNVLEPTYINSSASVVLSAEVNNQVYAISINASSSTTAQSEVNNEFQAVSMICTSSADLTSEVYDVFQPGALALANSEITINTLINGVGSSDCLALANVDSGSLVNNIFQPQELISSSYIDDVSALVNKVSSPEICTCSASANMMAAVNNEEYICNLVSAATTTHAAVVIKEVPTNITLEVTGDALLIPELFKAINTGTETIAIANAELTRAENPIRPNRSINTSLNPVMVEADPIIRLI